MSETQLSRRIRKKKPISHEKSKRLFAQDNEMEELARFLTLLRDHEAKCFTANFALFPTVYAIE